MNGCDQQSGAVKTSLSLRRTCAWIGCLLGAVAPFVRATFAVEIDRTAVLAQETSSALRRIEDARRRYHREIDSLRAEVTRAGATLRATRAAFLAHPQDEAARFAFFEAGVDAQDTASRFVGAGRGAVRVVQGEADRLLKTFVEVENDVERASSQTGEELACGRHDVEPLLASAHSEDVARGRQRARQLLATEARHEHLARVLPRLRKQVAAVIERLRKLGAQAAEFDARIDDLSSDLRASVDETQETLRLSNAVGQMVDVQERMGGVARDLDTSIRELTDMFSSLSTWNEILESTRQDGPEAKPTVPASGKSAESGTVITGMTVRP